MPFDEEREQEPDAMPEPASIDDLRAAVRVLVAALYADWPAHADVMQIVDFLDTRQPSREDVERLRLALEDSATDAYAYRPPRD